MQGSFRYGYDSSQIYLQNNSSSEVNVMSVGGMEPTRIAGTVKLAVWNSRGCCSRGPERDEHCS